jgi:hypothetical protein
MNLYVTAEAVTYKAEGNGPRREAKKISMMEQMLERVK